MVQGTHNTQSNTSYSFLRKHVTRIWLDAEQTELQACSGMRDTWVGVCSSIAI